jgi:2-keto-3-deoxy-L-rhamnonate aldolase RhmA
VRVANPKTLLRERVASNSKPLGMMVSSSDPAITDILGGAGYDFIIIDNEHGPMGPETAQHHVRAAEAFGMIPMVRVGENSANLIGKFLDVGCQGIIVPHVDTAEDARQAVAATRFAPAGVRGMCPASHAAGYRGGDTTPFVHNAETETILAVIVESQRGLDNIEAIAAVDGIDIIFFGPGDLSHELGVVAQGWTSPLITNAWKRILTAARQAGTLCAGATLHDGDEKNIQRLWGDGADLVVVYIDLLLAQQSIHSFVPL